jgi:amidase
VYPTLRRKPARLGDGQGGSNCTFSAHSGLPALGVPAAWSSDGLPLGIDIVGRPWSESELLSLGYAMEQTWKLRRPPFSTPALVNGKAPASRSFVVPIEENGERLGVVDFTFDPTTIRLAYKTVFAPKRHERVNAMWIQRGGVEKPAAALHQLLPGAGNGSLVLTYSQRADLAAGRLVLRTYTTQHPLGIAAALSDR